jgi:hypothetical protein
MANDARGAAEGLRNDKKDKEAKETKEAELRETEAEITNDPDVKTPADAITDLGNQAQ